MGKIKVTQIRSRIRTTDNQSGTLRALGLRRISHSVTHDDGPQLRGMIDKVAHLVKVEEVTERKRKETP